MDGSPGPKQSASKIMLGFIVRRIFLSLWWDVKCPDCHGTGFVQLPTVTATPEKT